MRTAWSASGHHATNFASFVVFRGLALAVFAVSVPTFINHASAKEYGIIAIGFSLLSFTTLLEVAVGFVITQSVGRHLARTGALRGRLFSRLFWIYVAAATLVAATATAVVLALPQLTPSQRTLFIWLAGLLPFLAASGSIAAIYQAHNDLLYLNSSRFVSELGKGLALGLSGFLFHSSAAVGPIVLSSAIARAALDLFRLRKRYGHSPEFDRKTIALRTVKLLSMGAPVLACTGLFLTVTVSDKLLIARYVGAALVAPYALAFDISTKAYLFVYATNSSIFALILRNHAVRQSVSRYVRVSIFSAAAVAVLFYLPFSIFARQIVAHWVNPAMGAQTAPIARFMAAAAVCYLFGNAFENTLLAMGKARLVFFGYMCAVLTYFLGIAIQLSIFPPSILAFGRSYLAMMGVYAVAVIAAYRIARTRSDAFAIDANKGNEFEFASGPRGQARRPKLVRDRSSSLGASG